MKDWMADWAQVRCPNHGHVKLDYDQYMAQMRRPDYKWECPECGGNASFDDDFYEKRHPNPDDGEDNPDHWKRE